MNSRRVWIMAVQAVLSVGTVVLIKKSVPYSDNDQLIEAEISIDSIWTMGPAAAVYDKSLREYFWLKSYSTDGPSALDTLKFRKAKIRYMKFLKGPLENRIFWMKVDSTILFDQVVEPN